MPRGCHALKDIWKAVVSIPLGNGINLAIGDFVGVVVDFLIVAVVVFLIVKYGRKIGLK